MSAWGLWAILFDGITVHVFGRYFPWFWVCWTSINGSDCAGWLLTSCIRQRWYLQINQIRRKKTNRKVYYRLHIVLIFQCFALSYFIIPHQKEKQNKNKTQIKQTKNNKNKQKIIKTKQNRIKKQKQAEQKKNSLKLLKSNLQNINNIISFWIYSMYMATHYTRTINICVVGVIHFKFKVIIMTMQ